MFCLVVLLCAAMNLLAMLIALHSTPPVTRWVVVSKQHSFEACKLGLIHLFWLYSLFSFVSRCVCINRSHSAVNLGRQTTAYQLCLLRRPTAHLNCGDILAVHQRILSNRNLQKAKEIRIQGLFTYYVSQNRGFLEKQKI